MARRVISRITRNAKPLLKPRLFTIPDFWERNNKVLVLRKVGGLGDILMHRMLFYDMKKLIPDCQISFACPGRYHDVVRDHPYIDLLLDSDKVSFDHILTPEDRKRGKFSITDYIVSYITTVICGRTEMTFAPFAGPHRSDIWANHCGFNLTNHDMHIRLTDEEKKEGKEIIEQHRNRSGKCVILSPASAMIGKNLDDDQMIGVIKGLHERGYFVAVLHDNGLPVLQKHDVPMIYKPGLRKWLGIIHEADYVISVDTATLHASGGLGRPTIGIFSWASGATYCKYYPTVEVVQIERKLENGWRCPCYNWSSCPLQKQEEHRKPCITDITPQMVLTAFDKLIGKTKNLPIISI